MLISWQQQNKSKWGYLPMELFILGGTDYTSHILVPSYNVQRDPVTKTWEDATYHNHTDLLRWRLKGSFNIYFDDLEELNTFLDTLNYLRGPDNYIEATLYDNDERKLVQSKYNFKIALPNNKPYFGRKQHDGYTIQVEEW